MVRWLLCEFYTRAVSRTDPPFIKPATSKEQQHRAGSRNPKATDTLATIKEGVMKASSPEEGLSF